MFIWRHFHLLPTFYSGKEIRGLLWDCEFILVSQFCHEVLQIVEHLAEFGLMFSTTVCHFRVFTCSFGSENGLKTWGLCLGGGVCSPRAFYHHIQIVAFLRTVNKYFEYFLVKILSRLKKNPFYFSSVNAAVWRSRGRFWNMNCTFSWLNERDRMPSCFWQF